MKTLIFYLLGMVLLISVLVAVVVFPEVFSVWYQRLNETVPVSVTIRSIFVSPEDVFLFSVIAIFLVVTILSNFFKRTSHQEKGDGEMAKLQARRGLGGKNE